MTDHVPPDLAQLVAAERTAPVPGEAARVAIRAKLGTTLSLAAPTTKTLLALKVMSILVGLVAVGTTIAIVTRSETRASAAELRVSPSRTIEDLAFDVRIVEAAPDEAAPPREPDEPLPPPHVAAVPSRSQADMLAEASRLLGTEPARSLEVVEEDAGQHPRGALDEEREALRIRALLALGRAEEARTAAEAFREAYPRSIHARVVDRALTERTSP